MTRQIAQKITAGDTYKVVFNASPYSSADGFGVTLYLTGPSGSPQHSSHTANANATATLFDIRVAPAVSANLAGGFYSYSVVASDGTDSYTLESGNLTIEPRSDNVTNTDLRSHNQKVYDAICSVIEGRATSDVGSYTIAGRTLTKIPLTDLIELQKYYKDLVASEQGKTGTGPSKLYVRFS